MRVSHLTFNFGSWRKGGNRVYNNNVHAVAAHKRLDDFQSLFAIIGLGNK